MRRTASLFWLRSPLPLTRPTPRARGSRAHLVKDVPCKRRPGSPSRSRPLSSAGGQPVGDTRRDHGHLARARRRCGATAPSQPSVRWSAPRAASRRRAARTLREPCHRRKLPPGSPLTKASPRTKWWSPSATVVQPSSATSPAERAFRTTATIELVSDDGSRRAKDDPGRARGERRRRQPDCPRGRRRRPHHRTRFGAHHYQGSLMTDANVGETVRCDGRTGRVVKARADSIDEAEVIEAP